MNKHSRGPWIVGNRYGNQHTEIASAGYSKSIGIVRTHEPAVENPKTPDDYRPFAEGVANAHLIAAAPELLAALRKIAEMTPDKHENDWDGIDYECGACQDMIDIAKAAVAMVDNATEPAP
jgi:hypothetical protein